MSLPSLLRHSAQRLTSLTVCPTDLDGSQVVEKLLEFKCRKSRPPRVICSLMESGEKSQASSAQLSAANSCTLSKAPLATALHYCDITHRSLNLMISFPQELRSQRQPRPGDSCSHCTWRCRSAHSHWGRSCPGQWEAPTLSAQPLPAPGPLQRGACPACPHGRRRSGFARNSKPGCPGTCLKGEEILTVREQNTNGTSSTENRAFRMTYVVQRSTWGSRCLR